MIAALKWLGELALIVALFAMIFGWFAVLGTDPFSDAEFSVHVGNMVVGGNNVSAD